MKTSQNLIIVVLRGAKMHSSELMSILDFLRDSEKLKNTIRSAWTSDGRPESVAEHTWRLCLMSLIFENSFPDIDFSRLVKICIIHDLGEAIGGDIPAPLQASIKDKSVQERHNLLKLLESLPGPLQNSIIELWDEYELAASPEAKIAKALDKIETILQHNQGKNPEDFDYCFNLDYGKKYTGKNPLTAALRKIIDCETKLRAQEIFQD